MLWIFCRHHEIHLMKKTWIKHHKFFKFTKPWTVFNYVELRFNYGILCQARKSRGTELPKQKTDGGQRSTTKGKYYTFAAYTLLSSLISWPRPPPLMFLYQTSQYFQGTVQWDAHEIVKSRFYVVNKLISRGPCTF